jgi:hypothetical protein
MAAVQPVGAGACGQGDPAARGPHQEGEQVAGGAVSPVQILQHQQHGGAFRQAHEQAADRVEQLQLVEPPSQGGRGPRLAGQVRQQPVKTGQALGRGGQQLPIVGVGGKPPQGSHDRDIRQANVAALQAPAEQDLRPPLPPPIGQLGEQAGLADTRIAGQ